MTEALPKAVVDLLESLRASAERSGVFGSVRLEDGMLRCEARNSAEPAEYRVTPEQGRVWVSLVTENRWLSESIESDLVHTGDKLDELIEEEMVDLGYEGPRLPFEHFRSEDMLFTFRTCVPGITGGEVPAESGRVAELCLLGYEAAFRQLGDMDASGDDE